MSEKEMETVLLGNFNTSHSTRHMPKLKIKSLRNAALNIVVLTREEMMRLSASDGDVESRKMKSKKLSSLSVKWLRMCKIMLELNLSVLQLKVDESVEDQNADQDAMKQQVDTMIAHILSFRSVIQSYENVTQLGTECMKTGKMFYMQDNHTNALPWLQAAIKFHKIVLRNKLDAVAATNDSQFWTCYDYLADSQRQLDLKSDAYNSVAEGLLLNAFSVKQASWRWLKITLDVFNAGKQPKYLTLASKLKNFLKDGCGLTEDGILLAELKSFKDSRAQCHAYHESILKELNVFYERENTNVLKRCQFMLEMAKFVRSSMKEHCIKNSEKICDDALHLLSSYLNVTMNGSGEGDDISKQQLYDMTAKFLVFKFMCNQPDNAKELNFSSQLKKLDKMKFSEDNVESNEKLVVGDVDESNNQQDEKENDETMLMNECQSVMKPSLHLLEEALSLWQDVFATFRVNVVAKTTVESQLVDDFTATLDFVEILCSILRIHQNNKVFQALSLLMVLSLSQSDKSRFLFAVQLYVESLLGLKQWQLAEELISNVDEVILSMAENVVDKKQAEDHAGNTNSGKKAEDKEELLAMAQYSLCKAFVCLASGQDDQCLDAFEKLSSLCSNLKESVTLMLLKSQVCYFMTQQLPSRIYDSFAKVALQIINNSKSNKSSSSSLSCSTRLEWMTRACRLLSGISSYLFDQKNCSRYSRISDKWIVLDNFTRCLLEMGRCFVRVGLTREAKSYLLQALVYANTFSLKHRFCEIQLELCHMATLGSFYDSSKFYLSCIENVLKSPRNNLQNISLSAASFQEKKVFNCDEDRKTDDKLLSKISNVNEKKSVSIQDYLPKNKLAKGKTALSQHNSIMKTPKHGVVKYQYLTSLKKQNKNNSRDAQIAKTPIPKFEIFEEDDDQDGVNNDTLKINKKEGKKKNTKTDKPAEETADAYQFNYRPITLDYSSNQVSPTSQFKNFKNKKFKIPDSWQTLNNSTILESKQLDDVTSICVNELNDCNSCESSSDIVAEYLQVYKVVEDCFLSLHQDKDYSNVSNYINDIKKYERALIDKYNKQFVNIVRWVGLSKNKTISLEETAQLSSTFDAKNLLGILFSKLSVLSLHLALKMSDSDVLNTLLNESSRYFDGVSCLETVGVVCDAKKTMNKKKNIKTCNKFKDVIRRSPTDYQIIEATVIKFSSKFSWPSQCCSYLSEMQLLKSSMATLLDSESIVDNFDQNSMHSSSSSATTAPKKISESPVKKVSADDNVFLPPEAPVKKARKPRPLKLEISRSLSSHTFPSNQLDGSMKKGRKLKSIDDDELSDILADMLSMEDRECSGEAGTKTSEPCLSADLLKCFHLMHHDPPIVHYRNICYLLALSCLNAGLSNELQVAYYLAESVAVSFRHMTLVNINKKIRSLSEELEKTSSSSEAMVQESAETLEHLEACKDYVAFNKDCHYIEQFIEHIPSDWTVCQITLVNVEKQGRDQLILTRFLHGEPPLNIPLPPVDVDERRTLLEQFDWLLKENMNTMKVKNKKEWWDRRQNLDEKLDELLESFEKEWFSCWIGGLMGRLVDAKHEKAVDNEVNNFMKSFPFCNKNQTRFIKCLFNGAHLLDNRLILQALHFLARTSGGKSQDVEPSSLKHYLPIVQSSANKLNLKEALRGPVVFILDKQIQHLPLENMPSLMNERITRQLSLHCMFGQLVCQMKQEKSILRRGVNRSSVFYVVNPDNNLPNTQKVFQDWFETKEPEWTGVIGKPPTLDQLSTNLSTKDLFIYSGHGTGSKYLSGGNLQVLNCRSAVLLMGCSSGRLWTYGQLEPVGMINHYLLAGSCCVVANLWEVTDRDIDRYMESLLKNWMACGEVEKDISDDGSNKAVTNIVQPSASSSNKVTCSKTTQNVKTLQPKLVNKGLFLSPDTPETKEPKTSPSLRPKTCLLENAIRSRLACHFRFLIGAAPVVYGFPIRIDFNKNV